jgi:hypothetical protein
MTNKELLKGIYIYTTKLLNSGFFNNLDDKEFEYLLNDITDIQTMLKI